MQLCDLIYGYRSHFKNCAPPPESVLWVQPCVEHHESKQKSEDQVLEPRNLLRLATVQTECVTAEVYNATTGP